MSDGDETLLACVAAERHLLVEFLTLSMVFLAVQENDVESIVRPHK